MTNDIAQPAPGSFDEYFWRHLASMTADIEPTVFDEVMPLVDEWRQQQAASLSRSDAIRTLIDIGLYAARKSSSPIKADEVR